MQNTAEASKATQDHKLNGIKVTTRSTIQSKQGPPKATCTDTNWTPAPATQDRETIRSKAWARRPGMPQWCWAIPGARTSQARAAREHTVHQCRRKKGNRLLQSATPGQREVEIHRRGGAAAEWEAEGILPAKRSLKWGALNLLVTFVDLACFVPCALGKYTHLCTQVHKSNILQATPEHPLWT
jgi:hypothetical protein